MNTKRILFVGIGIIIIALIAITYFGTGIGVKMLDHEQEANNSSEIDRDRIMNWSEMLNSIVEKDGRVQELIDKKSFCGIFAIINSNKTYAEDFVRVGGHYEKTNIGEHYGKTILYRCEEQRLVGGKIYKITVDLNNETVKSIEEVNNQTQLDMIQEIMDSVTLTCQGGELPNQ